MFFNVVFWLVSLLLSSVDWVPLKIRISIDIWLIIDLATKLVRLCNYFKKVSIENMLVLMKLTARHAYSSGHLVLAYLELASCVLMVRPVFSERVLVRTFEFSITLGSLCFFFMLLSQPVSGLQTTLDLYFTWLFCAETSPKHGDLKSAVKCRIVFISFSFG